MKLREFVFDICLCVAVAIWPALQCAIAVGAPDRLADEARAIEDNLIAPCCWSQPVSQHQSAAAEEIRRGVREMLAAGRTRQEIFDHFVAIYGERILASPRARGFNALVYVLPWAALILGSWLLAAFVRRHRKASADPPRENMGVPQTCYADAIEKELRDLE